MYTKFAPQSYAHCTGLSQYSLINFNARSVLNKWNEISTELLVIIADFVCILETWLYKDCDHSLYDIDG